MINNGGLGWVHGVFGRGMKWGRQWIVTKFRGKNWKSLKTDLFAQNTRFSQLSQVASKLPRPVARTLKKKNLKNLSKCFSRGSREVSRENFWVPSRLDLPPANKSLEWVARNIKNPNFEKYSKYFSWLGHWPASEQRKISVWARDWDMRLDQPVTESQKQDNTIFEIFDIFVKTKDFPKTTKTLKNLFVFD